MTANRELRGAVTRLGRPSWVWEASFEDLQADIRTVLAALKSRPTPSAVQRAERAVVRAAMQFTAHDVRMNFGKLDTLCIRVLAERMKAKKARRP